MRVDQTTTAHKKLLIFIPYTVEETRHTTGELVSATDDQLTIESDHSRGMITVDRSEVDGLYISTDSHRHTLAGLVTGLGVGGILAYLTWDSAPSEIIYGGYNSTYGYQDITYDFGNATSDNVGLAAAVLVGSAVIGLIEGYRTIGDDWLTASQDWPVNAEVDLERERFMVQWAWRF